MDRIVDRVSNWYRLCALGGLSGWVRNRERGGINGAFEDPEEKDNGGKVVELCAERELRG